MSKFIIISKGGGGKTHLCNKMIKKGLIFGIQFTSRPKRDYEIDGEHYNFVSKEDFEYLIKNGYFIEYNKFNNWYYGTSYDTFYNCDLFIMSPLSLKEIDRKDVIVIYLDIDENIRRTRLSKRNDSDSVERRLKSDEQDFKDIEGLYDIRITNSDF
jgi:guanylate kinase